MFLGVEAGRAPKPPHPYPHSLEPTWLYRRDAGVGPLLSLPGERGINCLFFARLPSAGEGQPALAGGVRGIAVLQPRKLLGHARGQLAGLTSTTAFRQPGHPPCCPTGSGHDATAAAWGQHGTTSKPATAAIRTARQAPVQIQPPAIQSWACRCERRTTGSRRGTSGGPAASPDQWESRKCAKSRPRPCRTKLWLLSARSRPTTPQWACWPLHELPQARPTTGSGATMQPAEMYYLQIGAPHLG